MANRNRDNDELVSKSAAAIADRLSPRLAGVVESIQQRLAADIDELRGDPQLFELLRASTSGNVETVFDALRYDIPIERVEPPTAALEYARRLAQRGVPAHALVRAYRLGQRAFLEQALEEIRDAAITPALGLDVFQHISTVTFRYIDWISQQVVSSYETERDRWLENRNSIRAVRVRELLDSADEVDVDAATSAIRYPLNRTHLALILWLPEDDSSGKELVRLEQFLRDLTDSIETREAALFLATDRVNGWGWIPLGAHGAKDAVSNIRRLASERADAPYVAIGTPLPGVDGFRRSHRQAQSARAVAIAGGSPIRTVTAAGDPGVAVAALVSADLEDARTWIHETLGPLCADTGNDARLRETLRIFLREGSSYKAAAEQLNLHVNSVKYRVQRAVDRRGRPIGDDRIDVELALLVCHELGTTVLRSVSSAPE